MNPVRPFRIDPDKPFFMYDTPGDWQGTVLGGYIFDLRGDYIGFIRNEKHDVYTAQGEWIGNLIEDGRVVRRQNIDRPPLLKELPPKPAKPTNLPARAPLPPQTADLGYSYIDVLEWDEDVFKRLSDLAPDSGEE
ncbi:MAG: hypothetical protein GYB67_03500 [Chloroflexi bacterium]|nr:hypothetical protein [Chloroflexota bacterium]